MNYKFDFECEENLQKKINVFDEIEKHKIKSASKLSHYKKSFDSYRALVQNVFFSVVKACKRVDHLCR